MTTRPNTGAVGAMQIRRMKIADLSSDPANARKHNERNIATIMASLRRFGQQKPIVVDSTGVVRAGNGTLEAAIALGWDSIDAVETPLKGSEATAYAIADNRTAELAEWDDEILAATLNGLVTDDVELLAASGFTDDELAEILQDIEIPNEESPPESNYSEQYGVIVMCESEAEQEAVYNRLAAEGLNCKVVTT